MKIVRKKSIEIIREEKARVPELEQALTDLEIEGFRKDAIIAELEDTVAEDEQAITDLEIEVMRLQEAMLP